MMEDRGIEERGRVSLRPHGRKIYKERMQFYRSSGCALVKVDAEITVCNFYGEFSKCITLNTKRCATLRLVHE